MTKIICGVLGLIKLGYMLAASVIAAVISAELFEKLGFEKLASSTFLLFLIGCVAFFNLIIFQSKINYAKRTRQAKYVLLGSSLTYIFSYFYNGQKYISDFNTKDKVIILAVFLFLSGLSFSLSNDIYYKYEEISGSSFKMYLTTAVLYATWITLMGSYLNGYFMFNSVFPICFVVIFLYNWQSGRAISRSYKKRYVSN